MNGDSFWEFVRRSVIGRDVRIETPFGGRVMTYADHTASGRGLSFIEEYMGRMLASMQTRTPRTI